MVGLLLLDKIGPVLGLKNVGLYRDDGLAVIKNCRPQKIDSIRKKLHSKFNLEGLKIDLVTNLKITDFLDITLNLDTEKYYPYRKPNDTPLYINIKSNHPPTILKQLPIMIEKRLSDISYNEEEFIKSKPMYQDALRKSGYNVDLRFNKSVRRNRRVRRRNTIWFNPPFCKTVRTNIGKIFLKLLDKHFPTGHMFHKIFNRNNVRISYCCLDNMAQKISKHNKKILHPPKIVKNTKTCNCRKNGPPCPLDGKCLESGIIYKATVEAQGGEKHYYGACATTFKERLGNHKSSFGNRNYNQTTLSAYIWKLKDRNISYNLSWNVAARAAPYTCSAPRCQLCTSEKVIIAMADSSTLLNKKSELVSKCRHRKKFLLSEVT